MKAKLVGGIAVVVLILGAVTIYSFYSSNHSNNNSQTLTGSLATPTPTPTANQPSAPVAIDKEVYLMPTVSPTPSLYPASPSYLDSITNDEHIREQLYRMYGRFNGLIGNYDNYKTTTEEEWKELLGYTFLSVAVYERFAEVTGSEELKKDFTNLAALVSFVRDGLEDGTYSEDHIKALRYAYEIINDIQAWSLPQPGDDLNVRHKFGASFALENHEQASLIDDWIINNL